MLKDLPLGGEFQINGLEQSGLDEILLKIMHAGAGPRVTMDDGVPAQPPSLRRLRLLMRPNRPMRRHLLLRRLLLLLLLRRRSKPAYPVLQRSRPFGSAFGFWDLFSLHGPHFFQRVDRFPLRRLGCVAS